jgi:hypothetical protein
MRVVSVETRGLLARLGRGCLVGAETRGWGMACLAVGRRCGWSLMGMKAGMARGGGGARV